MFCRTERVGGGEAVQLPAPAQGGELRDEASATASRLRPVARLHGLTRGRRSQWYVVAVD